MTEKDQIQQLKTEIQEHLYLEGIIGRVEKRVVQLEEQVVSLRNRFNRMQAELKDEDVDEDKEQGYTRAIIDPREALEQYLSNLKVGEAIIKRTEQ